MPQSSTKTYFSAETFFVAVIKSAAIRSMDRAKQEKLKWFLFNAPEETQKQFFEIFKKEEALNKNYEMEKVKFAQKMLTEYEEEAKLAGKKLDKSISGKRENDEKSLQLINVEKLITDL